MKLINDKIWLGWTAILFIPTGSILLAIQITLIQHGIIVKCNFNFIASILMIILGAATLMRLIYIYVSKTRHHE